MGGEPVRWFGPDYVHQLAGAVHAIRRLGKRVGRAECDREVSLAQGRLLEC